MAREKGVDPYEFNSEGEVADYLLVVESSEKVDACLQIGVPLEGVIDLLYATGLSPEAVDEILRTRETREGSWN